MKNKVIRRMIAYVLLITLGVQMSAVVSAADTEKQYRYHHYVDEDGNISLCPYYGNWKYDTTTMQIEYTEWMSEPLTVDNGKYSTYTHVYQGTSCKRAGCVDKSCDTNRYVDEDGEYWFYQETRTVTVQDAKDESAEDLPEASDIPELLDTPDEANEVISDERDSVFNRIGVSITEYAIDLLEAVMDTFTLGDTITFGEAILSYKESIKVLLDAAVIGEVENEVIANALWEILEETSSMEDAIPDDVLDYAGALFAEAFEEQPDLWEPIIKMTITKAPKIVLYIASTGAAGKLLPVKLVLNVFEASADRFWKLGETIAEYWDVSGQLPSSLISRYNDLLKFHFENLEMTAEAAFLDRSTGTNEFLYVSENLMEMIQDSKKNIEEEINNTLTIGFRILHPNWTKALRKVLEELEALEIDYEEYYWDIVNES